MQLCGSLSILWHCLSLGLEWKLTFSSPVATAEFSKFAGILTAALSQCYFRIWNSSTRISSPSVALFVVMLPKSHLTSYSRMSGSRWVITVSKLSGSLRPFLYSSFLYSYHLFLISSASFQFSSAAQSCPPLCDPMDCSLTRLLRPWDFPGKSTGVGCHFLLQCMKVKSESEVTQLCPTLRDPMDCSLPGSSIHGILQARVLEWGAIAFSE